MIFLVLLYDAAMKSVTTASQAVPIELHGDTPTLRLFALLEVIASKDQYFSLQSLVDETGLPKPTLHRMLQQLETAHLLERSGDGRLFGTGVRLRRLAENLLRRIQAILISYRLFILHRVVMLLAPVGLVFHLMWCVLVGRLYVGVSGRVPSLMKLRGQVQVVE